MSEPTARCEACRAKLTYAESARVVRHMEELHRHRLRPAPRPPEPKLLCWVCLHLAVGNAKESAELELYGRSE